MSVVNMASESTIAAIVEAMLPRFSDSKLGLHMEIDMDFADHGYGADGSTRERKSKNVRRSIHFLFVRPSNYTKVLVWETPQDAVGLNRSPVYEQKEWFLASDHDSCWRDAVGSKLTDIYFDCHKKFEGRKIGDKPLRPIDLYQFVSFWGEPKYVQLDVFEQKDKQAERFSDEGRVWQVKFHTITFADLESVKSPDTKWMSNSGLLVKGSENHQRYLQSSARNKVKSS